MKIIELDGTTDASGDLIVTDTNNIVGYVEKVVMDYDDAATGADLTLTENGVVSQPIITVTNAGTADLTWYPRATTVNVSNTAFTEDQAARIFVTAPLKLVVAQGGSAKNVRLLAYLSDEF